MKTCSCLFFYYVMRSRQGMFAYSKGTFSITSLWKGSIRVQIRFWEYARLILAKTYADEKCHYFLGLSWKSRSLRLAQDAVRAFQTVDCLASVSKPPLKQPISLFNSFCHYKVPPCYLTWIYFLVVSAYWFWCCCAKKMENKYFIRQSFWNLLSYCISIFSFVEFNRIIE